MPATSATRVIATLRILFRSFGRGSEESCAGESSSSGPLRSSVVKGDIGFSLSRALYATDQPPRANTQSVLLRSVAQAIQDAEDQDDNEKRRIEYEKKNMAERYQGCKAWIGTSNRPLERICQIITDATRFNSPREKASSYNQCLEDAQACRDLMAE